MLPFQVSSCFTLDVELLTKRVDEYGVVIDGERMREMMKRERGRWEICDVGGFFRGELLQPATMEVFQRG